jgi:sortase A
MAEHTGPVIIRARSSESYEPRPGVHSHNAQRRGFGERRSPENVRGLCLLLTVIGLAALGYYGYTLAYQHVYQAYENWSFDRQIAKPPIAPATPRPASGAVLGRVEIGRLNLSAIVREGVDDKSLSVAVGHVPSTSLPGEPGNFVIAAHRDTLFRALKDIRKDDLVTMQTPAGNYTYQVVATKIVKPTDVSVLQADGGGLVSISDNGPAPSLLTMITCYPFYYVGSAPKRFIVEAKLVSPTAGPHSSSGRV